MLRPLAVLAVLVICFCLGAHTSAAQLETRLVRDVSIQLKDYNDHIYKEFVSNETSYTAAIGGEVVAQMASFTRDVYVELHAEAGPVSAGVEPPQFKFNGSGQVVGVISVYFTLLLTEGTHVIDFTVSGTWYEDPGPNRGSVDPVSGTLRITVNRSVPFTEDPYDGELYEDQRESETEQNFLLIAFIVIMSIALVVIAVVALALYFNWRHNRLE